MSNQHTLAGTAGASSRNYFLKEEPHAENGTALGFWIYLMSDCLIFAALFATHGVLGHSYAGGKSGAELFDLKLVAINTALLLLSSLTFGLAMLSKQSGSAKGTISWLIVTLLFGLGFLGIELYEFKHLIHEGAGPQSSAAMSAFFTLVGTHGLHVTFGSIWLVVLLIQIGMYGLTRDNKRRLMCLSMFWHFLDVIWIGVFTFVYLIGVL